MWYFAQHIATVTNSYYIYEMLVSPLSLSTTNFFVSVFLFLNISRFPQLSSLIGHAVIFPPAAIGALLYHVIEDPDVASTAPKFKNVSESTRRHVNNTKWKNIISISWIFWFKSNMNRVFQRLNGVQPSGIAWIISNMKVWLDLLCSLQ